MKIKKTCFDRKKQLKIEIKKKRKKASSSKIRNSLKHFNRRKYHMLQLRESSQKKKFENKEKQREYESIYALTL